VKLSTEWSCCY